MLKYRAISFPVLMGLLWAVFFAPEKIGMWVFAFCAVFAIGVATYECAKMVDAGLFPCFPKTAGTVSALLTASEYFVCRVPKLEKTIVVDGKIQNMQGVDKVIENAENWLKERA